MYAKIALVSLVVAVVFAAPTPGGGGHHKHVTIHVPYKVHTVHHHHVSKVPVPVHVVKEVPVIKEIKVLKLKNLLVQLIARSLKLYELSIKFITGLN
ncbi:hypothetical protein K1T71_000433 [Dendrolimus kikuchii]|uniref:Uncharacterized protein n=1 Tax=Dendrolimus kikuchii TaxID=765133 RepID=A0ACC1DJF7_9NEOP|nr:hypothetical protein K1T71_000433 [Dendrolimus kikuchii]